MQLSTISPGAERGRLDRPGDRLAARVAGGVGAAGILLDAPVARRPRAGCRCRARRTAGRTPSASSAISSGPFERGRIDADLVGAGGRGSARAVSTSRIPPATEKGMSITAETRRDPVEVEAAAVGAGGDVVEHQFVGAFVAIAQRMIDDVADVAMVAKLDALDHAAVGDVEAGDDPSRGHERPLRATVKRLFPDRLADDRARRRRLARKRGEIVERRRPRPKPAVRCTG